MEVTVNAIPQVDAGLDQTICDGAVVTLSGSGASSYAWDNGVIDGTAFSPGVGTTTYTVTGTDGNGCVSTDQVEVTVNLNPQVSINLAQDSVCLSGSSILLLGSPTGGNFAGIGVNGNYFYPTSAGLGSHSLMYTYVDSLTTCSGIDTIVIEVLDCTGIEDSSQDNVQVYPNPTFDRITIYIDGYNGPVQAQIYDSKGSLIKTINSTEFSIEELSRGKYMLMVRYKNRLEKVNVLKF